MLNQLKQIPLLNGYKKGCLTVLINFWLHLLCLFEDNIIIVSFSIL
jgi:hypothetical protein